MLALEVCLAGTDPVPTMVFDEVDAGVGGRAAVEVGRRLARLARERQVLVVTHLAQVAAFADRHVVVDKPAGSGNGGVTASDVRLVEGEQRLGELARMLAGSDTATAREHAAELLADAARLLTDATPLRGRRAKGVSAKGPSNGSPAKGSPAKGVSAKGVSAKGASSNGSSAKGSPAPARPASGRRAARSAR
jgi:DNA repair protein RecN (Recombination protein N)